jgi:hypothetical protein
MSGLSDLWERARTILFRTRGVVLGLQARTASFVLESALLERAPP